MELNDYRDFLLNTAETLLTIDSPSGFTHQVTAKAEEIARSLGYETRRTNKGGLIILVPGREKGMRIGLCAHIDTLGLMCRAVTEQGELMFTKIGGPQLPTLDGEYCRIYTRDGRVYTGTILSLSPAAHVFDDALTRPRDEQNMYVRLDEKVRNSADVQALGIEVGDYICVDPKTTVTDSGFLKSRFLDDKGSAACLLTLLKLMSDSGMRPRYDTEFHFTVYEEVSHGAATIPADLDELLAVDMGCVGLDLTCSEYQVSICAKDSAGPYDYELVSRLVRLAKDNDVDYAVDVYPHYTSDVAVAWHAGGDMKAALIGPGVHASHGMERTHADGMAETVKLTALYLECGVPDESIQ
ncbi:M42 family metallopeptidase [Oscillibacter sp. MSJ-2]|uniref:M42 family metallopeptidase n=1 Tax=Dysosmobacter acutus TaxID=2841504 RepID=A0ABS6FAF6_9FIRM|nr:M42 family metallopeptidase [Dysosmobacter acutus]MBU5627058.1 M42 family metallopeptidase [Dysosmobacter acutus]